MEAGFSISGNCAPLTLQLEFYWKYFNGGRGQLRLAKFASRISGALRVTLLKRSIFEVMHRHEMLRCQINTIEDRQVRCVKPTIEFDVETICFWEFAEGDMIAHARLLVQEFANRACNVEVAPSFLVRLGRGIRSVECLRTAFARNPVLRYQNVRSRPQIQSANWQFSPSGLFFGRRMRRLKVQWPLIRRSYPANVAQLVECELVRIVE